MVGLGIGMLFNINRCNNNKIMSLGIDCLKPVSFARHLNKILRPIQHRYRGASVCIYNVRDVSVEVDFNASKFCFPCSLPNHPYYPELFCVVIQFVTLPVTHRTSLPRVTSQLSRAAISRLLLKSLCLS